MTALFPFTSPAAIFFDFDGVLAESVTIKEDAFRQLFQPYGTEMVEDVIKMHRASGAISRVIKIERAHRELIGKPLTESELNEWTRRYEVTVEKDVVACPEVPGTEPLLVDQAAQAELFVVSGTPQDEMRRIVTSRGWDRFFSGVYGSPRLKDEIVLTALQEHGLAAEDCLFVGDTFTDRDAAVATGMPFVGRLNGVRANPFPPGTTLVNDMSELAGLLAEARNG